MLLSFSTLTPFGSGPIQIGTALAGTKIQAENFDNGGDPDAYHDTTPGNDNGAARAMRMSISNPQRHRRRRSGHRHRRRRISRIHHQRRPERQLRFRFPRRKYRNRRRLPYRNRRDQRHRNRRDPNTGGVDVMQTVTKTNIPLTAGSHVMRLAWTPP